MEVSEVEESAENITPEKPEIYKRSVIYARGHGELDKYRASMRENVACKEGIEQAIRENFDGMHLNPDAVKTVMEQYGAERAAYVLANTIQQKSWDGRFSGSNKEWAASVFVAEDINASGDDKRSMFAVNSHPAVLDGFTDLFRKELRDRGLSQDGKEPSEKPFIDHYYVVEDLGVRGPLAIKEYQNLEEALSAYFALPNDNLKALGIQNTNPMPGSLDLIQCQNGIDTMTMDYTAVEVWNNPEVQAVHSELELALALHDTEIAYELGERYFMIQTSADGFDYSFYDQDYHLIDGGVLNGTEPGEPAKSMDEAVHEVLEDAGLSFEDAKVLPADDFREKVEADEKEQISKIQEDQGKTSPQPEKSEPKLTFYAAECMEYPVLGEYHEAATLEEAKQFYDQIPSDRMNGGKGIGFNLDDGSDYAGGYPLVQGGKVATEMIDMVEHYRESSLVQQAVADVKRYYPDVRETEYQPREAQESAPVVEQKNVEEAAVTDDKKALEPAEKRSETAEKTSEGKFINRKESVLKALRERQAQIKEREKQLPAKQHDRKKEEYSL